MAIQIGSGVRSDINVTPLVDVVLVLLIIFMAITPLLEREMPVRLPEQSNEEVPPGTPPPTDQYVIRIQRDGRTFLNQDELDRPSLSARLRQIYGSLKGGVLFIDAEDEVIYKEVVGVIDLCREAGVGTVATVLKPILSAAAVPK
jgi:biopolymer transport protein TolR